MALSNWLRLAFNRLRYLTKPVPLASTLGLLLVGLFVWEYRQHPEWFGTYSEEETLPNTDLDLSGLTPTEQAAVADIDNLSLLMNELGVDSGGVPSIQALVKGDAAQQNTALQELLALNTPTDSGSAANASPFAQYLEQYRFGGRAYDPAIATDSSDSLVSKNSGASDPVGGQAASQIEVLNPLAFALQNQSTAIADTGNQTSITASEEEARSLETFSFDNTDESEANDPTPLSPGEFSDQLVTIPGVEFPVLSTLPQMSPPPGSTGYVPPASLELMPPLVSTGSTRSFPSSGTSFLTPATSTGTLNLSPQTGNVPDFGTPSVDVSNGYISPYAPVVPSAIPSSATTVPSPFSVQRPPGSHIGGGYIHTFSNPNGPSN